MHQSFRLGVACAALGASSFAFAQTVQAPFDQFYTAVNLGPIDGVPTPYGGLVIKADDPNTLLIGGLANQAGGAIYAVPLTRSCGKIVGFAGPGVQYSTAPNIDGGLAYGPGGVLFFTQYPINGVGQILPGSSEPDRTISLTGFGVPSSVGALAFIPTGFPGAGGCRVATYNGGAWSALQLAPAGDGTFTLASAAVTVPATGMVGPEGLVYIPAGSPEFAVPTLLVSEYSAGRVAAFDIDANGDPVPGARRNLITDLIGVEGATIDPLTGDFLFSTFGDGSRVIAVRGFNRPCPGDVNRDGAVNFGDLNTVLSNFGVSSDPVAGDTNGDCVITFADLNVVLSAFGQSCD